MILGNRPSGQGDCSPNFSTAVRQNVWQNRMNHVCATMEHIDLCEIAKRNNQRQNNEMRKNQSENKTTKALKRKVCIC